ncbi:Ca-activated chloride channel family protein [Ruminococcaceae bacterium KH2T8]|nr:Ca-activated chloride channel family protein [Ruminococcaceae bacterium KH2T8]
MNIDPILPIPIIAIVCVALIALKRKGVWNFIRQIIIAIMVFIICLRPSVPTDKVTIVNNEVDVLFVVDNTISMLAEDYGSDNGRRIDAVKADVETIMDDFAGARYALITFGDDPLYMVPYTTSPDAVIQAINTLEGETKNYADGTSMNTAFDTMQEVLEQHAAQQEDDKDKNGDFETGRIQVVFFISDGEITSNDRLRSYERLADYVDVGGVLGYGTTSGGEMYVRSYALDEEPELLQYYDSNYNLVTAISKIDEDNLEQIATDLGVGYYHMTKPSDVSSMTSEINAAIEHGEFDTSTKEGEGKFEIYWAFAGALAAFLMFDLFYYRKKMGTER